MMPMLSRRQFAMALAALAQAPSRSRTTPPVGQPRREAAMAMLARIGRPAGSAFITLPAGIRERLWERVQRAAKPARKANPNELVKPGTVGRVRYLRGESPLDMRRCEIGEKSKRRASEGSDRPIAPA